MAGLNPGEIRTGLSSLFEWLAARSRSAAAHPVPPKAGRQSETVPSKYLPICHSNKPREVNEGLRELARLGAGMDDIIFNIIYIMRSYGSLREH